MKNQKRNLNKKWREYEVDLFEKEEFICEEK